MPQNTDIAVTPNAWVLLTDGNVTAITVQAKDVTVLLKATAGATPPTDATGAWTLAAGEGLSGDLVDYWRGVPGANRVYARAQNFPGTVAVSHA